MNLILNRITQGFGVLALGFMIFVSFYLTQTGLHAVGTNFQGLFIVLCALVLLVLHIVLTMLQLKKEKLVIFLLFILSMVGFYLIAYPGMHSTDTFLIADRGVTGLVTSSCSIFYSFYILGIRMIDSHLILLNIFQNLLLIYLVGQLFLQFNSTRLQMLLGILALNLMGMWYFVNISSRDHLLALLNAILFAKVLTLFKNKVTVATSDLITVFLWLLFITEIKPDAMLMVVSVVGCCYLFRHKIKNRKPAYAVVAVFMMISLVLHFNDRRMQDQGPLSAKLGFEVTFPILNLMAYHHPESFSAEERAEISKVVNFEVISKKYYFEVFWNFNQQNMNIETWSRINKIVLASLFDHKMLILKNMTRKYFQSLLFFQETPGALRNDMVNNDALPGLMYFLKSLQNELLGMEFESLKTIKNNYMRSYFYYAPVTWYLNPFLWLFIMFAIRLSFFNNREILLFYLGFNVLREAVIFMLSPWANSAYHMSLIVTFIVVLFYSDELETKIQTKI